MFKRLPIRLLDGLVNLSAALAALTLLLVAATILADVIGRNLLSSPLRGSRDIVQMALIVIIFGALALCDRQHSNISVDILIGAYPPWLNALLNALGRLLGIVIFVTIGSKMMANAEISILLNQSTNLLNIPKAPFEYIIAGFSFLTALAMAATAVQEIQRVRRAASDENQDEQ